jgi:glyoxylase-like metal-dependent hydrolase (beta-lactamase superfamily II)
MEEINSVENNKILIEPLVVGPLFSNCYVVGDIESNQGVIIDPGDEADVILNTIKDLGIEIKYILATHGHFDHVGAVNQLKKILKVDFLAHKDDLFFIEDGENAARRWGIKINQPPNPDRFIVDGEKIEFGKYELKVIHTPGHSPGGVCFLYNKFLFSGDTLFQGSIGRTDFRKGSIEDLKKSIKTRLYPLHDNTIVYTGHGPVTTIGEEKLYNAFVRA